MGSLTSIYGARIQQLQVILSAQFERPLLREDREHLTIRRPHRNPFSESRTLEETHEPDPRPIVTTSDRPNTEYSLRRKSREVNRKKIPNHARVFQGEPLFARGLELYMWSLLYCDCKGIFRDKDCSVRRNCFNAMFLDIPSFRFDGTSGRKGRRTTYRPSGRLAVVLL